MFRQWGYRLSMCQKRAYTSSIPAQHISRTAHMLGQNRQHILLQRRALCRNSGAHVSTLVSIVSEHAGIHQKDTVQDLRISPTGLEKYQLVDCARVART